MGRKRDDTVAGLRAAIDQLAAADASELLVEARAEARARLRARLTDAFTESMLDHLREQLVAAPQPRSAPRSRSAAPSAGSADPSAASAAPPAASSAATRPSSPARTANRAPESPTGQTARPDRAGESDTAELAWYVYGVVSSDTEDVGPLRGITPQHAVMMLREGRLAAVASHVPFEEFGEVRLREHLADMEWVEATARAHEAVLDEVQRRATVIPMRMCSVYRSDEGVRDLLRRESDAFAQALEHLAGRTEWGVKVFADFGRSDAIAGEDSEGLAPSSGEAPGIAYMQSKRRQRDEQERIAQLLEDTSAQIHERLATVAADALVLAPQRAEASGHSREMILNGVYLVPDETAATFHAGVDALKAEFEPLGIEIEQTGPWPAYNFVPAAIGAAW